MSATPRPWEAEPMRPGDKEMTIIGDTKYCGPGPVCFVPQDDCDLDEAKANAELIVRAVNSHDDLLAAAKRLVAVALEDKPEEWAEATFALEAAVKKAEGK